MAIKVALTGIINAADSAEVVKAFIERETGRKVKKIYGTTRNVYEQERGPGTAEFAGFTFELEDEVLVGPR